MAAQSQATRTPLSPILLLILILSAAVALSGCTMTGCNLLNTNYYYGNSYTVTVTGLSNYTGSDEFMILVPVPVLDGAPAYTEEQIGKAMLIFPPPVSVFADYQTVHESRLINNTGWTATLINTERGPMIGLTSDNASLSDIMLIVGINKEVPAPEREKYVDRSSGDQPLHPLSPEPAGSYTIRSNYSSLGCYASYVFIDGTLTLLQGDTAGNISVSAEYHELFAEGSVPFSRLGYQINESIPSATTGWIPVTVRKTG